MTEPAGLYLFDTPAQAGSMERRAVELVGALGLDSTDPIRAGYGHALIMAGRNLDRAETSRDAGKVDRALSRWVELLGKLGTTQPTKPEGAPGHDTDDAGDGPTEFDRYARAVESAQGVTGLLDAPNAGSVD